MSPFEEKYTAWVDGILDPREAQALEAELGPQKAAAKQDREEIYKLGNLLRTHLKAPALKNPDFFNHRISEQIKELHAGERQSQPYRPKREGSAETSPVPPVSAPAPASRWPFWRLIWAGGSGLGMAALLTAALALPALHSPAKEEPHYYAQILDTQPGDSTISAVAFHSKKENVTVLWLDGLPYVPMEVARK